MLGRHVAMVRRLDREAEARQRQRSYAELMVIMAEAQEADASLQEREHQAAVERAAWLAALADLYPLTLAEHHEAERLALMDADMAARWAP